MRSFPREAGLINAKADEAAMFDFGDINSASIGTTETEVAGLAAEDIDFLQDFAG